MAAAATAVQKLCADFPAKLRFLLLEKWRFKILYGGRGGAKSWGIARALLILAFLRPLRILCARETQKSIAESVHKLLSNQITKLGLQDFYTIEKAAIYGRNGSSFSFAGLKHNVNEIKSFEGCDIVWVEEGQAVSKGSWDTLIPTIRAEGSEIWASFNPELEDDDTYQRFVVDPSPRAKVVKIGAEDNNWFPESLREEMEECKARAIASGNFDEYNHIWEGSCVSHLAGAIFAEELAAAEKAERITRVPYDRTRPVDCYWDLGFYDLAAIWFVQAFPFEHRLIDYLEGERKTIEWYLQEMQRKGYLYGNDWLPWDIGLHANKMGSGRSIEELMRAAGRKVRILPKLLKVDQINAARTVFPLCSFDRERCADGLHALRHYRYGDNATTGGPTKEPIHDWSSHGSDAFLYFAVGSKQPRPAGPAKPPRPPAGKPSPWS